MRHHMKMSIGGSCLLALGLAAAALVSRAEAAIIKGPHLQNVKTDGITVIWEQETAGPGSVTINGTVYGSPGASKLHEVVITGLSPDTTYTYTVDGDGVTDSGTFTTAPSDPLACFSFLAVGDNRSIHADHTTVVGALLAEIDVGLLVNTGDMVSSGELPADWQFFFDIEYPLIRDLPWYPTIGNHETDNDALPSLYTDYLAPPTDTSGTESYYSFTYANTAFVVLDGHVEVVPLVGNFSSTQLTWLSTQLAAYQGDPAIQHIFVFVHEPPYSSKDGRAGSYYLRELLRRTTDPFVTYGVDAVITGHDHYMERGESPVGVPYYIMGGGGAPLYVNESEGNLGAKPATLEGLFTDAHTVHYAQSVHGYLKVTICNGQVDAEVKDTDGVVQDTLSWNTGDIVPPDPDAGLDAGAPSDAGLSPDAAGPEPDAAPADAALTPDAGVSTDAGSSPDAPDSGCSCRQTGGGAPCLGFGLLLLLLCARRCRSNHS